MRFLAVSALRLVSAAFAQTGAPSTALSPATIPTFAPVPDVGTVPVRSFKAPAWVIDQARTYRAVLKTNRGELMVELYPQQAPKAVNSFVFLTLNHFYDSTRFHRVTDGLLTASWRRAAILSVQCGPEGAGGDGRPR